MDKNKAKAVMAAAGVTVPGGGLFDRREVARDHVMPAPYVVKANAEGSSVGVFIVREHANRPPQEVLEPSWTFGDLVMVELLHPRQGAGGGCDGRQGHDGYGNRYGTEFYDYDAKYAPGGSSHVVPADLPPMSLKKR